MGDEFHAIYDCTNNDIQQLSLKCHEQLSNIFQLFTSVLSISSEYIIKYLHTPSYNVALIYEYDDLLEVQQQNHVTKENRPIITIHMAHMAPRGVFNYSVTILKNTRLELNIVIPTMQFKTFSNCNTHLACIRTDTNVSHYFTTN